MAKAATLVKPAQELEKVAAGNVAPIKELSTELEQEFEGAYGAGMSDNVEDRGTPLLYIAQKGSRQIDKNMPEYMPGLEVGMVFNNLTGEMWDAEGEGLPFLPCFFRSNWLEWTPREAGGGFHGSHPFLNWDELRERFDGIVQRPDRRDICDLPDGHELILTHHYFGIIPTNLSAVIIPMASTNLGASTRMQATINNTRMKLKKSGRVITPPAWILPWRLKTSYSSNDQGTWYKWSPMRLGNVNDEASYTDPQLRAICRELHDAVAGDRVKMSKPLEPEGTSSGPSPSGDVPI